MASVIDYKKENKDLYLPKSKPAMIDVPEMQFVAVEGKGNPNEENGEYQQAVSVLYGIQYTVKMSKKGSNAPKGYFDYVVPPLEGFWWLDNEEAFSIGDKSRYCWLSAIRLPEFVDNKVFEWACDEVGKKKNIDVSKAQLLKIKEGLCVQCLHIGPYDDEPETLKLMNDFISGNGLQNAMNDKRRHHEIYLSNPLKTDTSILKTILRIPVKK
jgi:hypothetical protein